MKGIFVILAGALVGVTGFDVAQGAYGGAAWTAGATLVVCAGAICVAVREAADAICDAIKENKRG